MLRRQCVLPAESGHGDGSGRHQRACRGLRDGAASQEPEQADHRRLTVRVLAHGTGIGLALENAGSEDFEIGAPLSVTYTGPDPEYSRARLFTAVYTPAAASKGA